MPRRAAKRRSSSIAAFDLLRLAADRTPAQIYQCHDIAGRWPSTTAAHDELHAATCDTSRTRLGIRFIVPQGRPEDNPTGVCSQRGDLVSLSHTEEHQPG